MSNHSAGAKNGRAIYIIYVLVTVVALIGIFKGWQYYGSWVDEAIAQKDRGVFGDKFGGLNTLFTGWAFAVLCITLIMQMHELKLQREEIKGSKKAQQDQVEEMKAQVDLMRKQMELMDGQRLMMKQQLTEGTFFQYLDNYHRTMNNLVSGKRIGRDLIRHLGSTYAIAGNEGASKSVYSINTKTMKQYYSFVEELLRFIDEIDEKEIPHKDVYAKLFKAQLSENELQVILRQSNTNLSFSQLASRVGII